VSGLHAELRLQADGYRLRDLGSTNGTHVRGVRVVDGFIAPGATIQIGKSAIVFDPLDESVSVPLWHEARLHTLLGGSAPMRHLFDLFYRLSVAKLSVPALRERREDIPALVEHFLRQLTATIGNKDPRLPDDFIARAQRHAWPGNVRELRNAVERACLLPNHPQLGFE